MTAELSSFIIKYGDKNTKIYKKAIYISNKLISILDNGDEYGDMGLEGYSLLIETLKENKIGKYNYEKLEKLLNINIKNRIEYDENKWIYYSPRPSNFIKNSNSPYYEDNKEILNKEMNYLLSTKPQNDVWPITWTWFDNMDKYEKEFKISEKWWKAFKAIEKMILLKNFKII